MKVNSITSKNFKMYSDGKIIDSSKQILNRVVACCIIIMLCTASYVYYKHKQHEKQLATLESLKPIPKIPLVLDIGEPKLKQLLVDYVMTHKKNQLNISHDFAASISEYALFAGAKNGLPPTLMLALVQVESRFDPLAVSHAGAKGLSQIIPYWHKDKLSGLNVFDPGVNIRVGAQILSEYIKLSNGDISKGLQRYNGSLGMNNGYDRDVLKVKSMIDSYLYSNLSKTLIVEKQTSFTILGE